jgi:hypothetical protein
MSLFELYQKRNKKLRQLGYKTYQEYLESEDWQKIRQKLQFKCCHFCKICEDLDKHHKSYKNLGTLSTKDIVVVCRDCHKNLHLIAACHLYKNHSQPLLSSYKSYSLLVITITRGHCNVIDFLESKNILKFLIGAPLLRVAKAAKIKRRLKICR